MNILIVDPSLMPDLSYQQRITQHLSSAADVNVRFAAGILDATWQARDFSPDVIVFERVGCCEQIRKLIALLRRINPGVAMFHLEGGSLVATEDPCTATGPVVPRWLQNMAMHWIFEPFAPIAATAP